MQLYSHKHKNDRFSWTRFLERRQTKKKKGKDTLSVNLRSQVYPVLTRWRRLYSKKKSFGQINWTSKSRIFLSVGQSLSPEGRQWVTKYFMGMAFDKVTAIKIEFVMVIYLRIKQSVCISDVILVTVQAIVGSCWSMHVHVRYTRLDEKSHEAAPNKDGLHDLHERKPKSVFNEKIKLCSCCHSNRFWRCQGISFNVVVRAMQALGEKKNLALQLQSTEIKRKIFIQTTLR